MTEKTAPITPLPIGLEVIPLESHSDRQEKNYPFITDIKGISMLPINDLEDAVLAACDIANDINDKSGVLGFLDNLPALVAAYDGKENILPQAAEVDQVELEALQMKVKERLKFSGGAEEVVDKAIHFLWSGGELYKAVQAAKSTPA